MEVLSKPSSRASRWAKQSVGVTHAASSRAPSTGRVVADDLRVSVVTVGLIPGPVSTRAEIASLGGALLAAAKFGAAPAKRRFSLKNN